MHKGWLPLILILAGCSELRAKLVYLFSDSWEAEVGPSPSRPGQPGAFDGADRDRTQRPVRLVAVLEGLVQPTDLQFVPGQPDHLVTLEKGGQARVWRLVDGGVAEPVATLLTREVLTGSEMGLLGLAFHPRFPEEPRAYINHNVKNEGDEITRVSEVRIDTTTWTEMGEERVLLEVVQPYGNHDAGQLVFGPDGRLYVGLGDGGWRDDPHDHGQNATTLLGSMLVMDVDAATASVETWATGLRNPWRYSFAPDGRMVVADVGQNRWEEIHIVAEGDNLGWNRREGRHCFPVDSTCPEPASLGLVEPIYEYSRSEGQSITGGYVYTGSAIPDLANQYIFGDFVTGRLWAIPLPVEVGPDTPLMEATALGRWQMLPSTFGRDADGEVYVADFASGSVFRLNP